MEKPIKENYGWVESVGFDSEPSGFVVEGGEEAYEEAMKKWQDFQDNLNGIMGEIFKSVTTKQLSKIKCKHYKGGKELKVGDTICYANVICYANLNGTPPSICDPNNVHTALLPFVLDNETGMLHQLYQIK